MWWWAHDEAATDWSEGKRRVSPADMQRGEGCGMRKSRAEARKWERLVDGDMWGRSRGLRSP